MTRGNVAEYEGRISAVKLYNVILWLKFCNIGYLEYRHEIKKSERKKLIDKYHLVYNKKTRQYETNEDELFFMLKEEFPDIITQKNIDSWGQLMYLALYNK